VGNWRFRNFCDSGIVSAKMKFSSFFLTTATAAIAALFSASAAPAAAPAKVPAAAPIAAAPAVADPAHYLDALKGAMRLKWPRTRIINLVFHGHSVPAGFFKTPEIRTFDAYPLVSLRLIKTHYPFAQLNAINTSIGGEASVSGAARFQRDVLSHRPDVVFIDYALNDRGLGLARARQAWEKMIEQALAAKIKVVLLTPTPDWTINFNDPNNPLEQHSRQIRALAAKYNVALVDSWAAFCDRVRKGENVRSYLSQINHPNERGHLVVAELIAKWF
jgi:lysophospholipase L1-like esterase